MDSQMNLAYSGICGAYLKHAPLVLEGCSLVGEVRGRNPYLAHGLLMFFSPSDLVTMTVDSPAIIETSATKRNKPSKQEQT